MSGFTIARRVAFAGFGLRSRRRVRMTVAPAAAGSGITFNQGLRADLEFARVEENCTWLKGKAGALAQVEHFLAACYGLGVSDIAVAVDGEEMPFGDGSALPFVRFLQRAGRRPVVSERRPFLLSRPVGVKKGKRLIVALPAKRLRVSCVVTTVPGKGTETGEQFFATAISPAVFTREVAPARTFGLWPESMVKWLERRLGFRLQSRAGIVFPVRFRFDNEFCRHKVLDLLGDISLLGRELRAEIFAFQPGHRLNLRLVRKLRAMEV